MLIKILWTAGSMPFIILGTIHLLYTFFSNKFSPRNKELEDGMKLSQPILTKQVTMWKAWVGFNASHSSGVIYIGIINFSAAIFYSDLLLNPLFISLNLATVLFYLWLGKKYWFSTPFRGVLISAGCFVAAIILVCLK